MAVDGGRGEGPAAPAPPPVAPRPPTGGYAIELRGIVKRFPGVVANNGVDLAVAPGAIHAIVGENGAGKSTLMKVLYGMLRPDEGTISAWGAPQRFSSPRDAIAVGIGMVHQHFMLAENFTVAENVVLGDEPTAGGRLDMDRARDRIRELGARYGVAVGPDRLVEHLGVGDRQRVEILKVLYRGARILILDEPTAVLVPHEVDELFASLRQLTAEGVTVIFISHHLEEVLAVADAITVIRAGTTVAHVRPADVTAPQLAELMVGSELPKPDRRESTVTDQVALDVAGLRVDDPATGRVLLHDVSLRIHRGEVVGIAGVEGNGQSELIGALVGLVPTVEGSVRMGERDLAGLSVRQRRQLGLGYVPEDRQREGLLLPAPLWENVMLGHQVAAPFAKGPWVDRSGARRRTAEIVAAYDVRAAGIDVAALALSGGNQQKLVVGREITAGPKVLIAAHPTRGVDVGAQAAIWDLIRAARRDGLAVLLVSADLEELIGLSDCLLVMLRGEVVATLDPGVVTPTELGSYMTGAHDQAAP